MKIVVLGGGISTERDVSLVSSRMIYEALKKKGHQAVLLDVYLGYEGDEEEIARIFEKDCDWGESIGAVQESNPDIRKIMAMRKDGGRSFFGPNVLTVCGMADAVFLGLHGADGENGKVQADHDLPSELRHKYNVRSILTRKDDKVLVDHDLPSEIRHKYNVCSILIRKDGEM